MLDHVITTLDEIPRIDCTRVVSPNDLPGYDVILDGGNGLNIALETGIDWAMTHKFDSILVLVADLPLLRGEDVVQMLMEDENDRCGIVALSKDGGTSGLLLHPPNLIRPCFGPGSGKRHIRQVESAGAKVTIVRSRGLEYDIDVPADLDLLPSQFDYVLGSRNTPDR